MKSRKRLLSKIGTVLLVGGAVLYIWLSAFTPACVQEMFEHKYMTYSDIASVGK